MLRGEARSGAGVRGVAIALASLLATTLVLTDHADARSRRSRAKAVKNVKVERYNPPYAAIVVDAKNGGVLHAANPDAPRHPASLTKIMTLYLLFERLESGKIALETQMPVSEEASSQAPTGTQRMMLFPRLQPVPAPAGQLGPLFCPNPPAGPRPFFGRTVT